jgi:pimeloyl-ACP methyl ester carboxylesterase
MTLIEVNGTALYYERRGSGPAILLVSGATGDAGHWTGVAEVLSSTYTVVTYDRRGNSRSPRPPGWTATTVDEHADDAEALISGLHLAPVIVVGTSAAAGIVANLAIRHPSVLRGLIFHEPVFQSGVTNAEVFRARRQAVIEEGMGRGAHAAAPRRSCAAWPATRCTTRSTRHCANDFSRTRTCSSTSSWPPSSPTSRRQTISQACGSHAWSPLGPPTAIPQPRATGDTNQHNGSPPS